MPTNQFSTLSRALHLEGRYESRLPPKAIGVARPDLNLVGVGDVVTTKCAMLLSKIPVVGKARDYIALDAASGLEYLKSKVGNAVELRPFNSEQTVVPSFTLDYFLRAAYLGDRWFYYNPPERVNRLQRTVPTKIITVPQGLIHPKTGEVKYVFFDKEEPWRRGILKSASKSPENALTLEVVDRRGLRWIYTINFGSKTYFLFRELPK